MQPRIQDFSVSAATAGFVAVLVGFTSSVAIVFQAATSLGATPAQLSSWMWALGHDCWQVTLNFGFKNEPDVPAALGQLRASGCTVDDMDTSYFLSRDIVIPTLGGGMADWREKLFASMHRNAAAAADFLSLPTNRVVELGSKVEI